MYFTTPVGAVHPALVASHQIGSSQEIDLAAGPVFVVNIATRELSSSSSRSPSCSRSRSSRRSGIPHISRDADQPTDAPAPTEIHYHYHNGRPSTPPPVAPTAPQSAPQVIVAPQPPSPRHTHSRSDWSRSPGGRVHCGRIEHILTVEVEAQAREPAIIVSPRV